MTKLRHALRFLGVYAVFAACARDVVPERVAATSASSAASASWP